LVIGDGDKVIATSPTGRRVQTGEPLTDEAVSHEALVERIDALGFVRDDADRAAQIGGRWGGARMTRWAESEIYRQLLEHCGGADPTADVVVGPAGAAAAAAARAMADEHFLRGEPPIAS
jgi:hypothetical protein